MDNDLHIHPRMGATVVVGQETLRENPCAADRQAEAGHERDGVRTQQSQLCRQVEAWFMSLKPRVPMFARRDKLP